MRARDKTGTKQHSDSSLNSPSLWFEPSWIPLAHHPFTFN